MISKCNSDTHCDEAPRTVSAAGWWFYTQQGGVLEGTLGLRSATALPAAHTATLPAPLIKAKQRPENTYICDKQMKG